MRTNSDNFEYFNQSQSQKLRLVVVLAFDTPIYFPSHDDIPNIPDNTYAGMLSGVSSVSQRLQPDEGGSTIGNLSFSIIDASNAISSVLRAKLAAGEGINEVICRLYRGGEGMDWSDFRLEQTQQVDRSVELDDGEYQVRCSDIQRAMRNDIFDLATTKLAAELSAGETTSMSVATTADFEACSHVASFGDQPTGSYYYVRIKYKNGYEIVRATGKTATTFTGLTRGMFGTSDVTHALPAGSDEDAGVEVEEYVYLELPAPAMVYALLTGNIIGGGTIPARWNLGVDTSFVDSASITGIGEDWFDQSDYSKGLIFRFQALTKTDGKQFIEKEVCLLAGAFLVVGADGKLGLRRMTGVIGSADFVAELNVDNISAHSGITHNLDKIANIFDVRWSWIEIPGERNPAFVRRNILADATSIGLHGQQKPIELSFKGLHNERHTYTTLRNRFDSIRDRYAGPPITMSVDLLPNTSNLEVGDIARVVLDHVQDFSADSSLDRSFEIQRISINQETGRVRAELFGSTLKATPIEDSGAGSGAELPDGWYSSAGTEMAAAGLTIDGAGVMTANGSLTGGTTTRTVFYYLGDFTIQSGVTLTVTGNVELRIRGQLQINGTLRASGGQASNTAGFIGSTYGGNGQFYGEGQTPYPDLGAVRVIGDHAAMPVLEIENDSGSLVGIPADMRGSGGGEGGDVMYLDTGAWVQGAAGGAGGAGGGSVVTVSRGAGYGVSGETDVSGEDGSTGAIYNSVGAGSGGGGAPGCLLHLLDGTGVTFPILVGNLVAAYGESPITNSEDRTQGKAKASDPINLGVANGRVAFVPKSRDPYPDYTNDEVVSPYDGKSVVIATVYQRAASAPSTPSADDGSYNFSTQTLTPPSGWSTAPPASNGNGLYASQGIFEIQGTEGIDSTVTWSTPILILPDSQYRDVKFQRSTSTPSTPTGDNPAGWYDAVPDGTAPLWQITGVKNSAGTLQGVWSTPGRIEGMNYRGTYAGGTAYLRFDVVAYNERTYILTVASSTGNAPSGTNSSNAYWDLLAGKGDPGDAGTGFTDTIAITSLPANLRSLADAAGYNGAEDATITFTLGSGVTGNGTAGAANSGDAGHGIDTGSWPSGTYTIDLDLSITGTVRGGGGGGGRGGAGLTAGTGGIGGDGGDAIYCQEDIDIIVNSGGVVQAGGGAGGGGGGASYPSGEPQGYGGGGGGGGFPNGEAGSGGTGDTPGTAGNAGTTGGGGTGGAGAGDAGDGGDGGNVNASGTAGDNAAGSYNNGAGGSAGAAGYAIRKNGNTVNVTNNGTITGTQA